MGNKDDIAALKELIGPRFDFEKLAPIPQDIEDNDICAWCGEHWGTKWEVFIDNIDVYWEESHVSMFFLTAWSPPEGIYNALIKKFPKLTVKWHYSENGNCFSGNFETGEEFGYPDPCNCGDCEECNERKNKD